MQPIPIAHKKEFKAENPYQGKFIIEPFYPGFGLTIGNALRRVLLSSFEGVAITAIRIKGVEHEFSTLNGVKEDVVDIILNLKQVRFAAKGQMEAPIKMELKAKGAKEVKAGDFKKVAGVEIANPDLLIATLTDSKAEFELEAWIEKGRGYLPTEAMPVKDKEVGVIAIDALFSPIKKVVIDTENVRVGEMTNWDRLILGLETDGTLPCEEALKKAAEILIEQFSFFVKAAETEKDEAVENEEKAAEIIEEEKTEEEAVVEWEDKPKKKRGRPRKLEE